MLKRFLYLDVPALTDYISALEGGNRDFYQTKNMLEKDRHARAEVRGIGGGLGRVQQSEEQLSLSDTPQARFERLTQLAAAKPKEANWLTVTNPNAELANVRVGTMIDIECEVYIPHIVNLRSIKNSLSYFIGAAEGVLSVAKVFGQDLAWMPFREERKAVKEFAKVLGGKLVAVGEIDDSKWRVAGQLTFANVNGEIDGLVHLIGKVRHQWNAGTWKPLLALPGSSLLPRGERQALEAKQPRVRDDENYLEGPGDNARRTGHLSLIASAPHRRSRCPGRSGSRWPTG